MQPAPAAEEGGWGAGRGAGAGEGAGSRTPTRGPLGSARERTHRHVCPRAHTYAGARGPENTRVHTSSRAPLRAHARAHVCTLTPLHTLRRALAHLPRELRTHTHSQTRGLPAPPASSRQNCRVFPKYSWETRAPAPASACGHYSSFPPGSPGPDTQPRCHGDAGSSPPNLARLHAPPPQGAGASVPPPHVCRDPEADRSRGSDPPAVAGRGFRGPPSQAGDPHDLREEAEV